MFCWDRASNIRNTWGKERKLLCFRDGVSINKEKFVFVADFYSTLCGLTTFKPVILLKSFVFLVTKVKSCVSAVAAIIASGSLVAKAFLTLIVSCMMDSDKLNTCERETNSSNISVCFSMEPDQERSSIRVITEI